MSRLIYSGDLNKNFGEFYPTPYIDSVTLRTTTIAGYAQRDSFKMDIEYSLLFSVPEPDPVYPDRDLEFARDVINRLNFYFIVSKSTRSGAQLFDAMNEKIGPAGDTIGEGPKAAHEERLQYYKEQTGTDFTGAENSVDELSLLMYDSSILVEFLRNPPETLYGFPTDRMPPESEMSYDSVNPNKGVSYDLVHVSKENLLTSIQNKHYTTFYTKSGRRILKIMASEIHQTAVKIPKQVEMTSGEKLLYERYPEDYSHFVRYEYEEVYNANINLLAFCSSLTPDQIRTSNIKTNAALSMLFGDVAYEHILKEGSVDEESQLEFSYFDANGEIYSEIPLRGLDGVYYKKDATNHEAIIEKFNQLMSRYSNIRGDFKKTPKGLRVNGSKIFMPGIGPTKQSDSTGNAELDASLESFSFVLTKYAKSPHLLQRIKEGRGTIMDRSTGTETGAFYNDTGELLANANNAVVRGTPLTKKLSINAKVNDQRQYQMSGYVLPSPKELTGEQILKNCNWGRMIVWSNEQSYRTQLSDYIDGNFAGTHLEAGENDDFRQRQGWGSAAGPLEYNYHIDEAGHLVINIDSFLGRRTVKVDNADYAGLFQTNYFAKEEYNVTFGYFLYDWEAHVRNNSYMAQLVNVERFMYHFGTELIQRYFVPSEAKLRKYQPVLIEPGNDKTLPIRMAEFENELPILEFTKKMTTSPGWDPAATYDPELSINEVYRINETSPVVGGSLKAGGEEISLAAYPEKFETKSGKTVKHYLTERNFGYMNSEEGASAYTKKMMAFEFQTIDQKATFGDHDQPVLDSYEWEVTVQDGTKSVLISLIEHYYFIGEALRSYLEDASQECNYNEIDGVFNDFFAESIEARESGNPAGSPWYMAAVAYVKNVDFMTGKYNGSQTAMLIAARNIVQRISPRSGTLPQLEAFYYNYIDFYTNYYSQASTLGRYMSDPESSPVDSDYTGYSTFATPHVRQLTVTNRTTKKSYSHQNESDRDEFLSVINEQQTRYNDASQAYAQAMRATTGQIAEDIQNLFELRKLRLEEKLTYEAQRISRGGGCQYVWWWDAYNGKSDFSDWGRDGIVDKYDEIGDKDEFSDIDPQFASNKYGYVWIDPYKQDDVVSWYDVEKYGEPSYYASYWRDKEDGKCFYLKRAYRFRPSQFRIKDANNERKYGWFSGDPAKNANQTLYDQGRPTQSQLKDRLRSRYKPSEGNLRSIPGFDIIQKFDSYEDWLRLAESMSSEDFAKYIGVSSDRYLGVAQQTESAYEQALMGFNQERTEEYEYVQKGNSKKFKH